MQLPLFNNHPSVNTAKPFLKWAGGKTQLLKEIDKEIPAALKNGHNYIYVEPFVGSGAVLFHVLKKYHSSIHKAIINDINPVLICTYETIKNNPSGLIHELKKLSTEYFKYSDDVDRKNIFYEKREYFNQLNEYTARKAALMIFLNKTCFNGLYRVNSKGFFNVPWGKYKNPKILDGPNIIAASELLQNVTIYLGEYRDTIRYVNRQNALFYFDPPYKPISPTSSFTSYSKGSFDDQKQIELKTFCDEVNDQDFQFMLSNSDVKNINPDDDFFDRLYENYNITRVKAIRAINSNAAKRGEIYELLITNYQTGE